MSAEPAATCPLTTPPVVRYYLHRQAWDYTKFVKAAKPIEWAEVQPWNMAIDPQDVNSSSPLTLQRYHELLPEYPNLYIAWVRRPASPPPPSAPCSVRAAADRCIVPSCSLKEVASAARLGWLPYLALPWLLAVEQAVQRRLAPEK